MVINNNEKEFTGKTIQEYLNWKYPTEERGDFWSVEIEVINRKRKNQGITGLLDGGELDLTNTILARCLVIQNRLYEGKNIEYEKHLEYLAQQNLKCNAMNPKNPAASLYENRAKLVNQALTPDLELLKRLQDLPYLNPDYQLPANLEIAQQEILNLRQQVKELAIDRDKTVAEIITISKNHRERQIQELTEQKDKAIQLLKEENHQLKEQLNQQKVNQTQTNQLPKKNN
ncbi:16469_t:CDS:2 [Entrophospora sp. SA101]|nr:16469_t:CDS:2 [Entrophospora sp. SA101]